MTTDAADALVQAARDEARRPALWPRRAAPCGGAVSHLPCKQHKVSMRLGARPATCGTALDRKVRNQIRKAEKSGLVVERGGAGLVGDFYTVFARNMRDLGTPVYSRRLFEEVLRTFPAALATARRAPEGRAGGRRASPIAPARWCSCRGRRRFASSTRCVRTCCCTGMPFSSRSRPARRSSTWAGRRRVKAPSSSRRSGARKPVPLHWEYQLLTPGEMPNVSPANPKFQLAIALWQKLPLALTTRVGPMIVRAIP